ncbi:hypothetical protein SAMN05421595_2723 [Austwickia chelonae]|nr:hypothetical protein SAMN05421595_2723 [Austwickia chelonae]
MSMGICAFFDTPLEMLRPGRGGREYIHMVTPTFPQVGVVKV